MISETTPVVIAIEQTGWWLPVCILTFAVLGTVVLGVSVVRKKPPNGPNYLWAFSLAGTTVLLAVFWTAVISALGNAPPQIAVVTAKTLQLHFLIKREEIPIAYISEVSYEDRKLRLGRKITVVIKHKNGEKRLWMKTDALRSTSGGLRQLHDELKRVVEESR